MQKKSYDFVRFVAETRTKQGAINESSCIITCNVQKNSYISNVLVLFYLLFYNQPLLPVGVFISFHLF